MTPAALLRGGEPYAGRMPVRSGARCRSGCRTPAAEPDAGPDSLRVMARRAGYRRKDDAAPASEARPRPSVQRCRAGGNGGGSEVIASRMTLRRPKPKPSAPQPRPSGRKASAYHQGTQHLSDLTQTALSGSDYQGRALCRHRAAGHRSRPTDSFDSRFGDWGPAASRPEPKPTMKDHLPVQMSWGVVVRPQIRGARSGLLMLIRDLMSPGPEPQYAFDTRFHAMFNPGISIPTPAWVQNSARSLTILGVDPKPDMGAKISAQSRSQILTLGFRRRTKTQLLPPFSTLLPVH